MSNTDGMPLTPGQQRRLRRDEIEAHCLRERVAGQSRRSTDMMVRLWPSTASDLDVLRAAPEDSPRLNTKADAATRILTASEEWQVRHELRDGAPFEVASHEAAHLATYQAAGTTEVQGEISGLPGGRGWCASASAYNPSREASFDAAFFAAENLHAEAVTVLFGPVAEHFLAGGDFYSSPGEIIATCLLGTKLGKLERTSREKALLSVLTATTEIVCRQSAPIAEIASLLERQNLIAFYKLDLAKLLSKVRLWRECLSHQQAKRETIELVRPIRGAPIDLAALSRSVLL